jgi:SAM-dependent methyltransferase
MSELGLSPPMYWRTTALLHQKAKASMDNRAVWEIAGVKQGFDLQELHGQAVRDYPEFEKLILGALLFLRRIRHPIRGCAVDMGSGTGVGACILSRLEFIEKVYALEMSEQFVNEVMPVVFAQFGAQSTKIQRVVGDFNHLELAQDSLDLILDIDSFHHSEDLSVTLSECRRVLKPGGVIVAVDRAWPDTYTPEHLSAMLDRQLNDGLKRKYGIPPETSFTRRDFGEHEYTLSQWLDAFRENGFDAMAFFQWRPPGLNRIFLNVPTFEASLFLGAFAYKAGIRRHWVYGFNHTRTLFVCIKREKSREI